MVISWQLFVPVLCFQASSLKHMYFFPLFFFVDGRQEAAGCRPHERQLVSASEGNATVADGAVTPSAWDDPRREEVQG